ncbi:MAG: aminotransferase class V-fold PLP-dependent enzyme [Ruminococcaceae bacterium]|nr:aminotransferase class V-fold PLP-dependent enzyme [Oscillospiraceae bacterium]
MIYLDNAATTFPKPRSVSVAYNNAVRLYGGNPGRSSHYLSRQAARIVYETREEIASLFDGQPENVVFTLNATYALNIAINALRKKNGLVLISNFEHNAVLRPVAYGGEYEVFDASGSDDEVITAFTSALAFKPSLVVCNHISNLCGKVLPVERIGKICHDNGIPFIIDASQSAGRRNLSLRDTYADAICAPGHKGLYGTQGSGFAIFADKYRETASELLPFVHGGNGVNSLEPFMPDFLPERFEGGTLPTPAIAALCAGIKEVKRITVPNIEYLENALGRRLIEGLSVIKGITVYGNYGGGTVLFNLDGRSSESVAHQLDENGICVRAGYHCCPLGHRTLNTPQGGAVRASVSVFNTKYDIDRLLTVLSKK